MIPTATYRLQMHAGFTLRDALAIVPYLHSLGISHLYTSSLLTAKPGSTHGYDVIDHAALNPEIGHDEDLVALAAELARRGMGLIVDVVPNHMSVGGANRWWLDVLENGPSSPYALYFDIAWNDHYREALRGKVLLPILGSTYGEAIDGGVMTLHYASGRFGMNVYEQQLPLDPRTWHLILEPVVKVLEPGSDSALELQSILNAIRHLPPRSETEPDAVATARGEVAVIIRRLDALKQDDVFIQRCEAINASPAELDAIIVEQAYRPCNWKVASDEINYRRFFDVNDLAALATERPEVFDGVHALIFDWMKRGLVQGLRIDHPDGLYDPEQYLQRIQEMSPDTYVVVEKILGPKEQLPSSWPCAGTTGYEFLNAVNGLFVRRDAEATHTRTFEDFAGLTDRFDDLVYRNKFLILQSSLTSELHVLAGHFDKLAQMERSSRDFTLNGLRHALRELLCSMPVYRTYVNGDPRADDVSIVKRAVRQARRRNPLLGKPIFDFLRDTLLLRNSASDEHRTQQFKCAGKFQQLSAPVMAKGLEDTTFYVYNRLLSLNEVGGEPKHFGWTIDELHKFLAERPHGGLSPLATHDTKRGEDTRARLNAITLDPDTWRAAVNRWRDRADRHRVKLDDAEVPDANEEYLLWQTLVATRPGDGDYPQRIRGFMKKAVQEAKVHSSWINEDSDYLAAVDAFTQAVLDDATLRAEIDAYVATITEAGYRQSLGQTLIRLTAPGVPDTYQGTELWDFSLVDPDNRRPVDYQRRQRLLAELDVLDWNRVDDERLKLAMISRVLGYRRDHSELFAEGRYESVDAVNAFAFRRIHGSDACVVMVPLASNWQCDLPGDWHDVVSAGAWTRSMVPALLIPARP